MSKRDESNTVSNGNEKEYIREYALDLYDEKNSKRMDIRPEFRQVAKDYFKILVDDAMRYNISEVPDLVLSMEYRNGEVFLYDEKTHFDLRA